MLWKQSYLSDGNRFSRNAENAAFLEREKAFNEAMRSLENVKKTTELEMQRLEKQRMEQQVNNLLKTQKALHE